MSLIKNATLESEAVFFDRLEKQRKIEDAIADVNNARLGLNKVRQDLGPPGVKELGEAVQEIERAREHSDSASRNLAAGLRELRLFHAGATTEAVAINEGRLDGAPLASKIRRFIKVAERGMERMPQMVTGPLNSPREILDKARRELTTYLGKLNEDDPRRMKLDGSLNAIDAAEAALAQTDAEAKALLSQLQKIRREYLPDCTVTPPPSLHLAQQAPGGANRLDETFQGGSRMLLQKSAPMITALEEEHEKLAILEESVGRVRAACEQGVRLAEESDSAANTVHEKVRRLHAESIHLLEVADRQLAETRRLLTQDLPGETKQCGHCGKDLVRTRKVLDPACICLLTNETMLQAEGAIRKAHELSQEMSAALAQRKPAADPTQQQPSTLREPIDELRRDKGVLDQLALALKRGAEFRNQEFDLYPGESPPPEAEEMPPREFPPMVAYYVARESWHYPLYFDDLSLERYGHHFGCAQPIISYGKFLADIAMLPYNVCLDSPTNIQYDHGLYRPGDCVPHLIYLPRWDCKAAFFEAAVWTGLFLTP